MSLDRNGEYFNAIIDFDSSDRSLMGLIESCKEEMLSFCENYNKDHATQNNLQDVLTNYSFHIWKGLFQLEDINELLYLRVRSCILLMESKLDKQSDSNEIFNVMFLSDLIKKDISSIRSVDKEYTQLKKILSKYQELIFNVFVQLERNKLIDEYQNLSPLLDLMNINKHAISEKVTFINQKAHRKLAEEQKEQSRRAQKEKEFNMIRAMQARQKEINRKNKLQHELELKKEKQNPHQDEQNSSDNDEQESQQSQDITTSVEKTKKSKNKKKRDKRNKNNKPENSMHENVVNEKTIEAVHSDTEEKLNEPVTSKPTLSQDTFIVLSEIEKSFLSKLEFFNKVKAYFVGGLVRGRILDDDYVPNDYDIVTNATEEQIKLAYPKAEKIGSSLYRVTIEGCKLEIWQNKQVGDDLRADALSRDFTINALYADKDGYILDPLPLKMSVTNLKNNTLVTCTPSKLSFNEDPMRALRLANLLLHHPDLKMSVGILKAIDEFKVNINPALEEDQRKIQSFNSYLNKLFSHGSAYKNFEKLKEMKLLKKIFPELNEKIWDDPWLINNLKSIDVAFSYSKESVSVLNNIFLSIFIIAEAMKLDNDLINNNIFLKLNFAGFNPNSLVRAKEEMVDQRAQYMRNLAEEQKQHNPDDGNKSISTQATKTAKSPKISIFSDTNLAQESASNNSNPTQKLKKGLTKK